MHFFLKLHHPPYKPSQKSCLAAFFGNHAPDYQGNSQNPFLSCQLVLHDRFSGNIRNLTKLRLRAIPFDIMRRMEKKVSPTPPHIFLFCIADPSQHIFIFGFPSAQLRILNGIALRMKYIKYATSHIYSTDNCHKIRVNLV